MGIRATSARVGVWLGCLVLAVGLFGCDSAPAPSSHEGPSSEEQHNDLDRDLSLGVTGPEVTTLHQWLARYGYLSSSNLKRDYPLWRPLVSGSPQMAVFDAVTRDAVMAMQGRAGLEGTGSVEGATLRLLTTPRCGVPEGVSMFDRGQKFALHGSSWSKTTLTWRLANSVPGLAPEAARAAVADAFKAWSDETNLQFEMAPGAADLELSFEDMDGPGGTVAAARFPDRGGDVTLDAAERWSLHEPTPAGGLDLYSVMLHQLGHALGLAHSVQPVAAMYPYFDEDVQRPLALDDRVAISALYDAWTQVSEPNVAADIGIGANASVWVVEAVSPYRAQRFTGSGWKVVDGVVGATRIAVAPDGAPWVCTLDGSTFTRPALDDAAPWTKVEGCTRDIAVGADGSVWSVGCQDPSDPPCDYVHPDPNYKGPPPPDCVVQKWDGARWVRDNGEIGAHHIAVDSTGVPWVVDRHYRFFRRKSSDPSSSGWEQLPGRGFDVSIGAHDETWAVGVAPTGGGQKLYVWSEAPTDPGGFQGEWVPVVGGATSIAVGADGPWAVNSAYQVWKQTGDPPAWQ